VRLTRFFFLATLFSVTFEKVHWAISGEVNLADILAICFLLSYAFSRLALGDLRMPRTAQVVTFFLLAFLLVYLIGYFNVDTAQAAAQFGKGMIKFVIHFLFLLFGVSYLARRSERFFWEALGVFTAGMVVNGAYGIVQLLAARSGTNLDSLWLSPLTGGASAINIYGAVEGATVFRANALTGDPNHLGVMLVVPLLSLTPLYLRLKRGHPWKVRLGLVLGFLFLAELTTLSRSGLLGLLVGAVILAIPYRRFAGSRALLLPLAGVALILAAVVLTRLSYFERVIRTRFETGGGSADAHLGVYDFVPQVLHSHPLFGLGLNNFSVYYEEVTGLTNWGPHSFYVALIVETGLVGTLVFACFLLYLFVRLAMARQVGRALAAAGEPTAARVTPLAWGMTAALAGTMAANVFYLTMSFYYFFAFATLALALPLVFAQRLRAAPAASPARRPSPRVGVAPARAG
jgi:O-antigen ligase